MKLSEISTDAALDILCKITPYLANIAADEELIAELKRKVAVDGQLSRAEFLAIGVEKFNNLIPLIFQKRKNDVLGLVGVLNGKTAAEIAEQNFVETLKQLKEVINDRELLDFFKSCTGMDGGA